MNLLNDLRFKATEIYCEIRIDWLRSSSSWMLCGWHSPWEERFLRITFSMLAEMASADEQVVPEELAAVEEFADKCLRLSLQQKLRALRAFREARTARVSFEELAKEFHAMFRYTRSICENMMMVLLTVAYADARRCAAEDRLIEIARGIFGIDPARQLRIKNRYFTLEPRRAAPAGYQAALGSRATAPRAARPIRREQPCGPAPGCASSRRGRPERALLPNPWSLPRRYPDGD